VSPGRDTEPEWGRDIFEEAPLPNNRVEKRTGP